MCDQNPGTVTMVIDRPPFDSQETIGKAKVGDKDALSKLWQLLNPGLVRYLASLGCKQAEDIASESWISLSKVICKFEGDLSAFQGLLFQIARARLYDQLRKDYRGPRNKLMLFDESAVQIPATGGLHYRLDEDSEKVQEWLSQLPKSQSEVVSLRVIVGLSHLEISRIIGKSEGAARILFFRGINNLQKIISGGQSKSNKDFYSSA